MPAPRCIYGADINHDNHKKVRCPKPTANGTMFCAEHYAERIAGIKAKLANKDNSSKAK